MSGRTLRLARDISGQNGAAEDPMSEWESWSTDRRPGFMRERTKPDLTIQIAVGVAIGILTAMALTWLAGEWRAQQAAKEAEAVLRQFTVNQSRTIEAANARAAAMAERARQEAQDRREAAAALQRQQEQAKRDDMAEVERREQAWARFYKRPAHCADPPTGLAMVECANQHIRAKRQFDELYSAGKL